MSRERQLAKNTLIISFGTVLPKVVNVITLPIITACLTKTEYGQYDLISTLVFLILPIMTLQIHSAAFRFLIDCRQNKEETTRIISTMLSYVIMVSAISVLIAAIFLGKFNLSVRILICLYFYVDMLFLVIQQITRGLSFNLFFSVSAIINTFVNLIVIIVTLQIMDCGLKGVLIALIIAAVSGTGYLSFRIRIWQYMKFKAVNFVTLKEMITYSWPMVPNNISGWVLRLSDRMIITAVLGVEANAVYAVANKIPNLLSTVQTTFTYAWQENASLAAKDPDAEEYYSNVFVSIFNMIVGLMALLVAFTPIMFAILIRGDYSEAYGQMPILFIGMMFSSISSVLGGIYVAHKRTKSVGISTVLAAVLNLAVDLLCVKPLGITAGSVSTLISYLILSVYRMFDVRRFQKIRYNYKKMLGWMMVLCLMCLICEQKNPILNVINMGIGIVAAFITNRQLIVNIFWKSIHKVRNRN